MKRTPSRAFAVDPGRATSHPDHGGSGVASGRRRTPRRALVPTRSKHRSTLAWLLSVCIVFAGLILPVLPASSVAPPPLPESSRDKTFPAGSYIIDSGWMGTSTTFQPKPEGLQAYGLIYQLLVTEKIPVYWIIANGKTGTVANAPNLTNTSPDLSNVDVYTPYTSTSITSKTYYSGPFVIPAEFMTNARLTSILTTVGLSGVRVDRAAADFTAPVYDKVIYWPKAILDAQNGAIAVGFYDNAKVPATVRAYSFKAPSELNGCDDIFVMPHADPTWLTHNNLLPWNDQGGYIWAGCHAASVLENIDSPDADLNPNMNFLTTEGLLLFGSHGDVARATTDRVTEALVTGSASVATGGAVSVTGTATNVVTAEVPGVAVGAAAITVMIADAVVRASTRAVVDGAITASASITVTATGTNTATATTLTVSIGIGASISVNRAYAAIQAGSVVEAVVGASASLHATGAITVTATGTSTATAKSDLGSAGLGLSLGANLPTAGVSGTTRARVGGNVTGAASLSVTASGTYSADARSFIVSIGLISGAGAVALGLIENTATVEALIGPTASDPSAFRPTLTVTGAVVVDADATMTATAVADAGAGGLFSISMMFPTASVDGVTRAYVREGVALSAGSLRVEAGDALDRVSYTATATTQAITIGFLGSGSGVVSNATIKGVVDAFIGNPVGVAPGGPVTIPTITAGGTVVVRAFSTMTATAVADGDGGGAVSLTAMVPTADVQGTTRAYVGQGLRLSAGALDIDADAVMAAAATSRMLSVSAVGISAAAVTAIVSGTVDAHVGSAAGSTPSARLATLVLTGALTVDAHATMTATPQIFKAGVAFAVDITVLFPVATLGGIVRAYVGEGVHVTAASVRIEASAPLLAAVANGAAIGFSGLVGIGVIGSSATVSAQVEAFVGAHRSVDASPVTTFVSAGSVQVLVDTAMTATATANSAGFSGALNLNVLVPTARVSGYAGAYVRDGVSLTGGTLTVRAGTTADRVVMAASASTKAFSLAALAAGAVVVADAIVTGEVEAFLGAASGRTRGGLPGAQIVLSGEAEVTAASDLDATATLESTAVGSVSINVLIPRALLGGATRAYAGDGTNIATTALRVRADADAKASATTEAVAVGIGGGNGANATAVLDSVVEAFVGERADTTRLTQAQVTVSAPGGTGNGVVDVDAVSSAEAYAENKGVGVAGLTISVLIPTAQLSGWTRAYLGPRTTIAAGTTTVHATETKAHATAKLSNTAVGGLVVSVFEADATISRSTEAFVGHHANLQLAAAALTVSAQNPNTVATASASSKGGGLGSVEVFSASASVGDDTVFLAPAAGALPDGTLATAARRGVTRASIDADAVVVAGDVTLDADATVTADTSVEMFSITAFLGVKAGKTIATVTYDAEAFVGDRARLTLGGALVADADLTTHATPRIENLSVSAGVGLSAFTLRSLIDSDVLVGVGDAAVVSAGSAALTGSLTNDPSVVADTGGFSGILSVNVITAEAKDTSRVEVRTGPATGLTGSAATPTSVTTTGNLTLAAVLTSTVSSAPKMTSFGIFGAGGVTYSHAIQDARVLARVGNHTALTSNAGSVSVLAEFIGSTHATGSGVGAGAVSVTLADSLADHKVQVRAEVREDAVLTANASGAVVSVEARHNHDGTNDRTTHEVAASSDNLSVGAVSVNLSEATAKGNAAVVTEAAATSRFSATAGTVRVVSRSYLRVEGTVNSSGGGIVDVSVSKTRPIASGTTTTNFLGSVGTTSAAGASQLVVIADQHTQAEGAVARAGGGAVTVGSASSDTTATSNVGLAFGASASVINVSGSITVTALGETYARAQMSATQGGAVSVSSGSATATVRPQLTLTVGAGSTWIRSGGNLTIQAIQVSDADSVGSGAGGGAISVSSFSSSATVEQQADPANPGQFLPTVSLVVNDTDTITAVGTLRLLAQHGPVTASVSDGTVLAVDGANGLDGNSVTFTVEGGSTPVAHLLGTGDTITYSGSAGGLESGRSYTVITRDAFSVFLGEQFTQTAVSTTADTITFAARHNFRTGDLVYFHGLAGATIGGLTSGTRYELYVVDDFRVRVRAVGSGVTATTSSADGSTDTLTTGSAHGLTNNTPVVYHAPAGITIASVSGTLITTTTDHDFDDFDAIYYDRAGSHVITGLTPGTVYWAVVASANTLRLATSLCRARGDANPLAACTVDDNGTATTADDDYVNQSFVTLTPSSSGTAVHSLWKVFDAPLAGLVDGQVYFVKEATATTFKLGTSAASATVVNVSTARTVLVTDHTAPDTFSTRTIDGAGHVFRHEGLDLTSVSAGSFRLVHDLVNGAGGAFSGLGGAESLADAPSGDAEVTASTGATTGGAIDISDTNATTSVTVTTNLAIGGGASLTGGTVEILTHSRVDTNATVDSLGIGGIAVGNPTARATGQNNSALTVASTARITAVGDLELRARTVTDVDAFASTDAAGFGSGGHAKTRSEANYRTVLQVDGTVVAGGLALLRALTTADANASSKADTGGVGTAANANDDGGLGSYLGYNASETRVGFGATASVTARSIHAQADTNGRSTVKAESDAVALGADADAVANAYARGVTQVLIAANARFTAGEVTTFEAVLSQLLVFAFADANCDCGGASTDSDASLDVVVKAFVSGAENAVITTAALYVKANALNPSVDRRRDRDSAWIDFGGRGGSVVNNSVARHIFWESTVIFLGEPNPVLTVDASGTIVAKTDNVQVRAFNRATGVYSALLGVGDQIAAGSWIVVGDLLYDESGFARFEASHRAGEPGVIWGNAAVFRVKETWDTVTITNASDRLLVTNDIDVVSSEDVQVEVSVNTIPGPTNSPADGVSLTPVYSGSTPNAPTFEFAIQHEFPKTVVLVASGAAASDIVLDGAINNPIGRTEVTNANGSIWSDAGSWTVGCAVGSACGLGIESTGVDADHVAIFAVTAPDADVELVRTNILRLDAPLGSIGRQAPAAVGVDGFATTGRVGVAAELVRFRDEANVLFDADVIAQAAGNLVLDLTFLERSLAVAAASLAWLVDTLHAGDDIDVIVRDPVQGTNLGDAGDVTVNLYNPANGALIPSGAGGTTSFTDARSGVYVVHFRPDYAPGDGLTRILRAFGTDRAFTDSLVTFGDLGALRGDVRAGDTLDVRHDETGAVVDFLVHTDVDSGTLPYPAAADDDAAQIFLRTNGSIVDHELIGDLRAGHVHSTGDDVTLVSPRRIVDADTLPTIDVTGVNLTLTASVPTMVGGTSGVLGGVGLPDDFLETNVDVLNAATGAIVVTDIAAASTLGVFLDELTGALRVDLVRTHADVSLRTVGGSILDRQQGTNLGDTAADVIAQTIALDANGTGADVGEASDDLDIDSQCAASAFGTACGAGTVGVEATRHVYLAETDADLRLVLAHASTGDIRITVRETTDTDEHLFLLASGTVRFAESDARAPGLDPDAPRSVPNGTIFAEAGSVTLRVGDNVDTHAHSQILANLFIDVYGDATAAALLPADLDPSFGTTVTLRGRIIADCVVTSGDPIGTCAPSTANPVVGRLTTVYGHTDGDLLQFGDPTGDPYVAGGGGTTWGSNGYVFLGSKTRAYGADVASAGNNDEDTFKVFYLQSMDVGSGQAGAPAGAGHTLTLDGRQDTDTYLLWTTGSAPAFQRNYVVNLLDTGASNDGVDEATIFGADATADLFLLRTSRCLDTEAGYGLNADGTCASPTETADRPGFVALLHGTADLYTTQTPVAAQPTAVQRVNYDTALNGRLTVEGRAGDDSFFADDTSVIVTLDGGAGNDLFQVGQVFGTHRTTFTGLLAAPFARTSSQPAGGNVAPADTFPHLVATTRGWLSPGIGAPLVAVGGTGNDRFTVYANQAELRLEGGDDNDIFTVRAFALAAVCNTSVTGGPECGIDDVTSPLGSDGSYLRDTSGDGYCTAADANFVPGYASRRDANGDGVCTAADALLSTATLDRLDWLAQVIPLDADGVARPIIGLGFSTARPLDIRAGGGEDEVSYNVNAPVSIDGGTGFDKVVVLGTEFADDFVITNRGIFGAGLNVRYTTVEVIEVDGLEGDDEFFVQSTAYGVAYRVIGGLGSDTINVTGDVVEDIVVRELEGVSGSVNHLVTSADPDYAGLPVDGIDLNVATPTQGNVVITESAGFTAVREGGPVSIDGYQVRLATAPTGPVYVTASAARSPQEEAAGTPAGDTLWVCSGAQASCDTAFHEFQRTLTVDGGPSYVANRAVVLRFTGLDWNVDQWVWVYAVDDLRSEGDRVVTVNHSVISTDARFDATDVRNVEVALRDNDTPGVYVTEIDPATGNEDRRTVVVEGTATTGLTDQLRVQLAAAPTAGSVIVKLVLDADADQAFRVTSADARWNATTRTLTFSVADWFLPVLLVVVARDDARPHDPRTELLRFELDPASTGQFGAVAYTFPSLYAPPVRIPVELWDDEVAGVVVVESDGTTQLVMGGATDDEWLRLTRVPTAPVDVAIVTDGLVDVVEVDGTAVTPGTYTAIGGYQPVRAFRGTATVAGTTITRGAGSDLGSFVEEGFAVGQFVRVAAGVTTIDAYVTAVTAGVLTLNLPVGVAGTQADLRISRLVRSGLWEGTASGALVDGSVRLDRGLSGPTRGWLADGFLEGQWVRVTDGANVANLKIDLIRGTNLTKDAVLQFTTVDPFTGLAVVLPAWLTGSTAGLTVTRIAAVATFSTTDWYVQQRVVFRADQSYVGLPGRENVKTFPASLHLLSRLQGPVMVEGGVVAGADRTLRPGVKLPGETDGPLFNIAAQAPESLQIDVLNVFNDSSQADGVGTLSQTTLTGFGMADDLDFLALDPSLDLSDLLFGESPIVPGGVSFGTISLNADGTFATNAGRSTLEVLNVMLGEGNDHLSVTGTLDPQPPVAEAAPATFTGAVTVAPAPVAGRITLTRASGSWKTDGFVAGQLVMVNGSAATWRVVGVSDAVLTLAPLSGSPAPASGTVTVQVPGRHGGLTIVHGGGNAFLTRTPEVVVATASGTATARRTDGLDWVGDGFRVGQVVTLGGALYRITAFAGTTADCTQADPFAGCGVGSIAHLTLVAGAPAGAGTGTVAVAVVDPLRLAVTPTFQIRTSSLVRTDGGSWLADGFRVGLRVFVEGLAGAWTVSAVTASTLTFSGAALTPSITEPTGPTYASRTRTVWADEPLRAGGVRVGGDTIVLAPAPGGVLGGPNSPLVLYGDTSQDAVWYSGDPATVDGRDFGPKPFDPFYDILGNEDARWVFPVANEYTRAGNDVIDASALFAGLAAADLPSVGVTIYGGEGDDLILGSQAGDHLAGGSGNDTILGARGTDHVYGDSGVNVDVLTRALTIPTVNGSLFALADLLDAGRDTLWGEGACPATWQLPTCGLAAGTVTGGPEWVYDDLVFGDHGVIEQHVADPNLPSPLLQKIQTTRIDSARRIVSVALQNGDDDVIFGGLGRDVLIAGAGHDLADGDEADDLVFGDNVVLDRTARIVENPTATDVANGVVTSGRFQTLTGTVLYSRTDIAATGATADTSGALLVDGTARDYRDPDAVPWWAQYLIDYAAWHTFAFEDGLAGAGSWGNDYLAGGAAHDLVFGQLGNDVLQGDGGIELAFAAVSHVGASRTPDGCVASDTAASDPTHAGTCDLVGDLDLVASFDGPADGQDYVEGGGGNDVVFGNLGQDDLLGGSSDFFSLVTPDNRPDGADLVFGGSGLNSGRNDTGGVAPGAAVPVNAHGADADAIVGDNGRIIRIVGVNRTDVGPVTRYVSFVYDDAYGQQLVVRGVQLLDYTAGGPDFRPDRFGQAASGTCHTGGSQTVSDCSVVFTIANPRGRNRVDSGTGASTWVEIFGNDEVHGELGDDTVYLGGGADVAYGDAGDDDLLGGWGNDWLSGGVGQDGILGDDGRIFTSRNNATVGEPLFGVAPLRPTGTCTANQTTLCGDYLNQWIATPGIVQTEVINVAGDLKKTVDLTPFNLTPNASGADQPLFDANNSDDVIFGGLGGEVQYYPTTIGGLAKNDPNPAGKLRGVAGDFLHGGAGDDALAGGEAIWNAYTQVWTAADGVRLPNAYRSDWTRPFNPGDLLHFGQDYDAWHDNGPLVNRLGEFALYDEYDPRRTILLNADGTANKTGAGLQWFLNLYSDEGPALNGCVDYAPNGTCLTFADRQSDGSDAIFGDLGNDWLVGGTGQDSLWGGWGNDLLNADDVMTIAGPGTFGDQKGRKIQPSPNDTPDTHPLYQDRAFGGAGLDVLIGNTGGDRLIDWVGEFNSYVVPFAPFGIATVSRQVPPWLYEFLYAVSASQGADPTRATDTGRDADRKGEPDGELGLVTQRDHGLWQDQTGGPSDPQPGNVPGGKRDVLRSADFNDASTQAFAADSGVWDVQSGQLVVGAASQGGDAAAVYNIDQYLPVYFEVAASVYLEKPTGGWKANAYVVFDYFARDDFKFAGLDQSTNKLVMGRRTAAGWVYDVQASISGGVKANTWYSMLVTVNGTTVTVVLNGRTAFSYTFAKRLWKGELVGLNKGFVGVGSNNARGRFDNIAVQVLPVNVTYDRTEAFATGAGTLTDAVAGAWTVGGGVLTGVAPTGGAGLLQADLGGQVSANAYLELSAKLTLDAGVLGGISFDGYSRTDHKVAALDLAGQRVLLGHVTASGLVVDAAVAWALVPGTAYTVVVTLKGASVSVTVNGALALSRAYNSALADGRFGLYVRGGRLRADDYRVRTDGFTAAPPPSGTTATTGTTTTATSTSTSTTTGTSPPTATAVSGPVALPVLVL